MAFGDVPRSLSSGVRCIAFTDRHVHIPRAKYLPSHIGLLHDPRLQIPLAGTGLLFTLPLGRPHLLDFLQRLLEPLLPFAKRPLTAFSVNSYVLNALAIPVISYPKNAKLSTPNGVRKENRQMAQLALKDLGTNALPGILKVLNESNDVTITSHQLNFAEAVQYIGPSAKCALPAFTALLKSGQQERAYSGAAALAFSTQNVPEAFSILTNALTDPSPGVRDAASYGMASVSANSVSLCRRLPWPKPRCPCSSGI